MEDNFYKSSKKLTDRGWQAMQVLLDRDMPVERRRQRPLWLFWLACLLVVLSGIFAWLTWPATESAPIVLPANQPVAKTDRQIPSASGQKELSMPTRTEAASIDADTPTLSNKPAINSATAYSKTNNRGNTTHLSIPERTEANSTGGVLIKNEILESNRRTTPTVEKVNSPDYTELTDKHNDSKFHPVEPVVFLPLKTIPEIVNAESRHAAPQLTFAPRQNLPDTSLASNPSSLEKPIDPVSKINPPRVWSFGATTGLLTNLDFQYSGATTGLAVEWQPSPKWGIRSGLLYQFRSVGKDERSILQLRTDAYTQLTGDNSYLDSNNLGPILAQDIAANPVFIPVSRLHRLELPVLAFWQPVEKWRLYGGLSVGINVYAQTAPQSLRNNTVLDIPSGKAAQNLNQEISAQVRSWDARWSAGIGFKPNRRFAFDLLLNNPLRLPKVRKTDANLFYSPTSKNESFPDQLSSSRPEKVGGYSLLQFSASVFF